MAGTVRIPGFQRGYVWEPTRAALLMDSLHKGYPVGSLLLWRTRSRLKSERRLGVFELPDADPDYPLDYVLDGQQRLTSIFSTFQTDLEPSEANPGVWLPIYYDFDATTDAQESAFVALASEDANPERYFPLNTFLDAVEFSRHARDLSDERNAEIARVQQRFLETLIPVETFETEERTTVAIVFERVNRMGVELDVFQLLTAWTWSDEFDLQKEFLDLADEFSDFGFGDLGTDSELMLRCTAAALRSDPSPSSLVDMTGAEVRGQFDDVAEAMRRAIDFAKTNFFIRHLGLLPYSALLVPLTAFFFRRPAAPVSDEQHRELVKWFWRSSFSHRYSGNPQRNIRRDITEAVKLRDGGASDLAAIPVTLEPKFLRTTASASGQSRQKHLSSFLHSSSRGHSSRESGSTSSACSRRRIGASTTTVSHAQRLRLGANRWNASTLSQTTQSSAESRIGRSRAETRVPTEPTCPKTQRRSSRAR